MLSEEQLLVIRAETYTEKDCQLPMLRAVAEDQVKALAGQTDDLLTPEEMLTAINRYASDEERIGCIGTTDEKRLRWICKAQAAKSDLRVRARQELLATDEELVDKVSAIIKAQNPKEAAFVRGIEILACVSPVFHARAQKELMATDKEFLEKAAEYLYAHWADAVKDWADTPVVWAKASSAMKVEARKEAYEFLSIIQPIFRARCELEVERARAQLLIQCEREKAESASKAYDDANKITRGKIAEAKVEERKAIVTELHKLGKKFISGEITYPEYEKLSSMAWAGYYTHIAAVQLSHTKQQIKEMMGGK